MNNQTKFLTEVSFMRASDKTTRMLLDNVIKISKNPESKVLVIGLRK